MPFFCFIHIGNNFSQIWFLWDHTHWLFKCSEKNCSKKPLKTAFFLSPRAKKGARIETHPKSKSIFPCKNKMRRSQAFKIKKSFIKVSSKYQIFILNL